MQSATSPRQYKINVTTSTLSSSAKKMRYITLLTVLVLAVYVNAGKVIIGGSCVDCNTQKPDVDSTTVKPLSGHNHGGHSHTDKSHKKTKQDDDSSGDSSEEEGRFKRQWGGGRQIIRLDDGPQGGSWSGGGGRVTTIDGRSPGTVVRNDDCVGCNIRG